MIRRFIRKAGVLTNVVVCAFLVSPFIAQAAMAQLAVPKVRKVHVESRSELARNGAQASLVKNYGQLPLAFEPNEGQSDPQAKFISRGAVYGLFLTPTEAVLRLWSTATSGQSGAILRMRLLNTNSKTEVFGQEELPGKSNYFRGNDPTKWQTNVPHFAKVRYRDIYPGVDLVYYGQQRELEYDFVLQPGVDPGVIRLSIEGARRIRLKAGDLLLSSAEGEMRLRRPHIYQEVGGSKRKVQGEYCLIGKKEVGFRVTRYDRRRVLVIDPVLAYSSYLGGGSGEYGRGIAVDAAGNAYITGNTYSNDFPTVNAIQPAKHGISDAFVTKINASGTAVLYSTYLGDGIDDLGTRIAVDTAGNAYITGSTHSSDFPIVNAIQPAKRGFRDAFVTKLNASGSALVYSTYLGGGGDDYGDDIATDVAGNTYVLGATSSNDFPTVNALQPTGHGSGDAFVTKINADGSALVYSTYLGGSGTEWGAGIAVDKAGNAYVSGTTESTDFPTANAIQSTNHGYREAFVTKFNAQGNVLIYSTYLGGGGAEWVTGIAVDNLNNVYVTGPTSSNDFPMVNALQSANHGNNAFVTKLNASGSAFLYSTYLGGIAGGTYGDILSGGIAVDSTGSAYVSGTTYSPYFPTVNPIQSKNNGISDAFVSKINPSGSALVYSTYLGGSSDEYTYDIAADAGGSAYVTGRTQSQNFPKTPAAFQPLRRGADAFVIKIAPQTFVSISPQTLTTFSRWLIDTASTPKQFTLTNAGPRALAISTIDMVGVNGGDFTQTNTCPAMLPAGGTCNIWVTFGPTAKDTRKAALTIIDSDPASPQAVALTGIGTVVSISPKSLSFANQRMGITSARQTVILTNVGSAPLHFSGISVIGTNANDFSETNNCGLSVDGGMSCTITVTFKPTGTGSRKATVSINNDGGGSPQKILMSGIGT
jgi:beta-propeller repeat-containing protein/HYDIN/CFA65/VesB family protein